MLEIVILLFGLTLLFASVTNMLHSLIRILVVQGLLLFGLTLLKTTHLNWGSLVFIAVETLLFKAIAIPWFISDTISKNHALNNNETALY
ncbi:MAG TPA: hypothetical protein PKI59_05440, partial [Candidatus Cloacimonadota bacterium]|nr:hypothetical protein [Candidatus Cloacimonadota bacterium]